MERAAVGFRVKSGWAVAVLLGGPATAPTLLDCRQVDLSDPDEPEARQPYHSRLEIHGVRGAREAARLVAAVQRYARRSLARLFRVYRERGGRLAGVGIVAGSVADPGTIANDHIRAHAEEGRLFREVIVRAAGVERLPALVMVEREIYTLAVRTLGRTQRQLKEALTALGRDLHGSWRAEHKGAALAAWMVLGARRGA